MLVHMLAEGDLTILMLAVGVVTDQEVIHTMGRVKVVGVLLPMLGTRDTTN